MHANETISNVSGVLYQFVQIFAGKSVGKLTHSIHTHRPCKCVHFHQRISSVSLLFFFLLWTPFFWQTSAFNCACTICANTQSQFSVKFETIFYRRPDQGQSRISMNYATGWERDGDRGEGEKAHAANTCLSTSK